MSAGMEQRHNLLVSPDTLYLPLVTLLFSSFTWVSGTRSL